MADDGAGCGTEKPAIESACRDGIVAYCASCRCERVFVRRRVNHLLHLLATVLSLGLWLVVWLGISFEGALRPWRCKICGWHKPEFRVPLQEAVQMGEAALHGSRRESALRMIRRDHAALISSSGARESADKPGST
jgi:hypothetical protein